MQENKVRFEGNVHIISTQEVVINHDNNYDFHDNSEICLHQHETIVFSHVDDVSMEFSNMVLNIWVLMM